MEEDEEGILIFREGERERYPWGEILGNIGIPFKVNVGSKISKSYRAFQVTLIIADSSSV